MRVLHRIGQLHLFTIVQETRRIPNDFGIQCIRNRVARTITIVVDAVRAIYLDQKRVQIQIIQVIRTTADLTQQVRATDDVIQ